MFKVSNTSTRRKCEICSKLRVKTLANFDQVNAGWEVKVRITRKVRTKRQKKPRKPGVIIFISKLKSHVKTSNALYFLKAGAVIMPQKLIFNEILKLNSLLPNATFTMEVL